MPVFIVRQPAHFTDTTPRARTCMFLADGDHYDHTCELFDDGDHDDGDNDDHKCVLHDDGDHDYHTCVLLDDSDHPLSQSFRSRRILTKPGER